MNTNFKNLMDFLTYFKDEETCQKYFEQIRFRDGEYCPHCHHTQVYKFSKGKRYRCAKCKKDFTIKIGSFLLSDSGKYLRFPLVDRKRKEPDKLPDSIPPNQTS